MDSQAACDQIPECREGRLNAERARKEQKDNPRGCQPVADTQTSHDSDCQKRCSGQGSGENNLPPSSNSNFGNSIDTFNLDTGFDPDFSDNDNNKNYDGRCVETDTETRDLGQTFTEDENSTDDDFQTNFVDNFDQDLQVESEKSTTTRNEIENSFDVSTTTEQPFGFTLGNQNLVTETIKIIQINNQNEVEMVPPTTAGPNLVLLKNDDDQEDDDNHQDEEENIEIISDDENDVKSGDIEIIEDREIFHEMESPCGDDDELTECVLVEPEENYESYLDVTLPMVVEVDVNVTMECELPIYGDSECIRSTTEKMIETNAQETEAATITTEAVTTRQETTTSIKETTIRPTATSTPVTTIQATTPPPSTKMSMVATSSAKPQTLGTGSDVEIKAPMEDINEYMYSYDDAAIEVTSAWPYQVDDELAKKIQDALEEIKGLQQVEDIESYLDDSYAELSSNQAPEK